MNKTVITIKITIESINELWQRSFIVWIKQQLQFMKKDFESRHKDNKVDWTIEKEK